MHTRRTGTQTGLTATAHPSSGPAPGSFDVHATGGVPPYVVSAAPSPPNPDPMPRHDIDGMHVEIEEPVPPDTVLYFKVEDQRGDEVHVTYTVTAPQ